MYDGDTELTYMGARYYPGDIGRFISQDPAYLAVGNDTELEEKTNLRRVDYLANPQFANSYSYTINNPINLQDKSGEFVFLLAAPSLGTYLIGSAAVASTLLLVEPVQDALFSGTQQIADTLTITIEEAVDRVFGPRGETEAITVQRASPELNPGDNYEGPPGSQQGDPKSIIGKIIYGSGLAASAYQVYDELKERTLDRLNSQQQQEGNNTSDNSEEED